MWEAIPTVHDLQCWWQILLQSANPRANHTLRTLPPSLCAEYGQLDDEGVWNTAVALLGQLPGTEDAVQDAKRVASLPMRMGCLGRRSAVGGTDAAYWASWAPEKSGRGGHGCGDHGSGGASIGTVPV